MGTLEQSLIKEAYLNIHTHTAITSSTSLSTSSPTSCQLPPPSLLTTVIHLRVFVLGMQQELPIEWFPQGLLPSSHSKVGHTASELGLHPDPVFLHTANDVGDLKTHKNCSENEDKPTLVC